MMDDLRKRSGAIAGVAYFSVGYLASDVFGLLIRRAEVLHSL